jgi:hypothetical protein
MNRRRFVASVGRVAPLALVPGAAFAGPCFTIPEISGEAQDVLLDTKSLSVGAALQKWLLANRVNVEDKLFVSATDLAFENHFHWPAPPRPIRGQISVFTVKTKESYWMGVDKVYDGKGWVRLHSPEGQKLLDDIAAELQAKIEPAI